MPKPGSERRGIHERKRVSSRKYHLSKATAMTSKEQCQGRRMALLAENVFLHDLGLAEGYRGPSKVQDALRLEEGHQKSPSAISLNDYTYGKARLARILEEESKRCVPNETQGLSSFNEPSISLSTEMSSLCIKSEPPDSFSYSDESSTSIEVQFDARSLQDAEPSHTPANPQPVYNDEYCELESVYADDKKFLLERVLPMLEKTPPSEKTLAKYIILQLLS